MMREWHTLTPTERQAAWCELVDWVIWLHDRYELAVDHRLPHCWPQHPGLIEELTALKAWRDEIYTGEQPAGQAARYWHAELRHVVHAATTSYAAGCRAGHKSPATLAAANPELRSAWLGADPLSAVPAGLLKPAPTSRRPSTDGRIGDHMLYDALDRGDAYPLGQQITDYIHYQDQWWTAHPDGGWIPITDPLFAAELDRAAQRMAAADAAVNHQARRRPERS
jgi:hypothetical protein